MRQSDKEYAHALFRLSVEEGQVEKILGELLEVKELILQSPLYPDLLSTPAIPLEERLTLVDEAFGAYLSEYTLSFIKLLCEAGRAKELLRCIDEFATLERETFGRMKVRVISAVPLTDSQKSALTAKLEKTENRRIDAEYVTDPAIMGGLVVETADKIYDGSLKSRLSDVKDVMMR